MYGSLDPIFDQSSLFFVHPNDGPSSVIINPMLTDLNYHFWMPPSYMHPALDGKTKLKFIDDTIVVPVDQSIPLKV
jgi:hypothetical protein